MTGAAEAGLAKSDYRPDIDGLRAIAIAAVVLYHYGAPLSGGFVGVDVFFVISGFLITGLIVPEIDVGSFRFLRFYARRVRRILPALLVMCIAVMAAAYWIMLPKGYKSLGVQAITAAVGVSNFYFFRTATYFGPTPVELPLLHTWSLGVEEQFYAVWPITLLAISSIFGARWRLWALTALTLVAFAGALFLAKVETADYSFYMLPTRFWELALGGTVAMAPVLRRQTLAKGADYLGLLLVAVSLFTTQVSGFPAPGAAVSCLGAALLVWRKEPVSAITRILSSKSVVGIGLISYSLYLWHWPVLLLGEYLYVDRIPPVVLRVLCLLVSMGLALLSHRFVESPLRRAWTDAPAKTVFLGAAASLFVVLLGTGLFVLQGIPTRLPPQVIAIANAADDSSPFPASCHRYAQSTAPIAASCVMGAKTATPSVAVWADSHGVEMSAALGELLATNGLSLKSFTYSSCPPAVDLKQWPDPGCNLQNDHVLSFIGAHPEIGTVVMTAYFSGYGADQDAQLRTAFSKAVSALLLDGRRVVVLGPTPYLESPAPQRAAMLALTGDQRPLSMNSAEFEAQSKDWRDFLATLGTPPHYWFFPAAKVFCQNGSCPLQNGTRTILMDNNHLSMYGARLWVASAQADLLSIITNTPNS